jgi:hypothetical protein
MMKASQDPRRGDDGNHFDRQLHSLCAVDGSSTHGAHDEESVEHGHLARVTVAGGGSKA